MTSRVRFGGLAVLVVSLALWSSIAEAGSAGSQDGGDTVTVGASTSSSSPGSIGAPAPDRSASGSGPTCTYTPVELAQAAGFDLDPGGPTPGEWYLAKCTDAEGLESEQAEWVPTVPASTPAPVAVGVSPAEAAATAAASIVLPAPTIEVNPVPFSVVNLSTWLAIDAAMWHPYQATATVGGVTATAVAKPETVSWAMGDGGSVECNGPGTSYDPDLPPEMQATSCSYTYRRSSYGQPSSDGDPNDGAFVVTATVTWNVSWTAVGAAGGGTLPSLHTTSTTAIRVEQVESVGIVQ